MVSGVCWIDFNPSKRRNEMTEEIEIHNHGSIRVSTGFLGLGTPRYFQKNDVEVIEENFGSCSAAVGSPITFKTKDGELLRGHEEIW